jgi:hypothetical protein
MKTPQQVLTDALKDLQTHGYDSPERVEKWVRELSIAIERTGINNDDELKQSVRAALTPKLHNASDKAMRGMSVGRFTKANLSPRLYNELDRRILASTALIKLNRTTAINETLQRFIGWSTSIPAGGAKIADKSDVKQGIKKSMSQLNFIERRVTIDQTSKLIANVNNIVAVDGGAIAVEWNSNWKQRNYNYRHDHKELDGKIFLIKDSWADKEKLLKGDYYENLPDQFGQAIFCQCYGTYIFRLNRLPTNMLTKKGQEYLKS